MVIKQICAEYIKFDKLIENTVVKDIKKYIESEPYISKIKLLDLIDKYCNTEIK